MTRHCAVGDGTNRCVSLCKLVLSHDYGHVLSHDVSHDVVTHDAPCSLSPHMCLHSPKDASMHIFTEVHIFPLKLNIFEVTSCFWGLTGQSVP